jgi:hypothetical protein
VLLDYFREVARFVVLFLIRPILKALVAITSPVYKVVFGWADNRTYRKLDEAFEEEIRQNLTWLFRTRGAQVIPNTRNHPRAFDYTIATVAVGKVLLRFIRGRGELRADVASTKAPEKWYELREAIGDVSDTCKRPNEYYRLADVNHLLEEHLDRLETALSHD